MKTVREMFVSLTTMLINHIWASIIEICVEKWRTQSLKKIEIQMSGHEKRYRSEEIVLYLQLYMIMYLCHKQSVIALWIFIRDFTCICICNAVLQIYLHKYLSAFYWKTVNHPDLIMGNLFVISNFVSRHNMIKRLLEKKGEIV